MDIDRFEMERFQSLYWHQVEFDLSESGVRPLTVAELLDVEADPRAFLDTPLGYPLSEGSPLTRERIAQWYPGAGAEHVTVVNGGSEANHLVLWTLLDRGDRLAFMVPNYLQGVGLGNQYAGEVATFPLRLTDHDRRWALDVDALERAVTPRTRVVMVCNPDNPTGHVLTAGEMDAVITAAERVGAWIVADEIYRGAEVGTDEASPTFWGRYDKVVITSGLSKAFGLPGLRVGWVVAPPDLIARIWERHDYTTLTPGMLSDRLCAVAMEPTRRDRILARTRGIVREHLPRLREWIDGHGETFRFAPPAAGAIAFVEVELPGTTAQLVERIRVERSVLLVSGEVFGVENGIRFGFGYDLEHTMEGLARVDETLAAAER